MVKVDWITDDQKREIVRLYTEGYGLKATSQKVFGRKAIKPINRVLREFGIEKRTCEEGKAVSKAYQDRYNGKHARREELKKLARKKLPARGAVWDLPLFKEGHRLKLNERYKERYANDPAFRIKELYRRRLKKIVYENMSRLDSGVGIMSWLETLDRTEIVCKLMEHANIQRDKSRFFEN